MSIRTIWDSNARTMLYEILFYGGVLAFIALLYGLYRRFSFVPLVLLVYGFFALVGMSSTVDIPQTKAQVLDIVLVWMIVLMVAHIDINFFMRMGRTLFVAFFSATFSLVFAFVVVFYLVPLYIDAKALATLSASWSGGTANLLAIARIIDTPQDVLGYVLAVDALFYGAYLMGVLFLVGVHKPIDRLLGAKALTYHTPSVHTKPKLATPYALSFSLIVALIIVFGAPMIPTVGFASGTFYQVLLATLVGLGASRFNYAPVVSNISSLLLYSVVALIALGMHVVRIDNALALAVAAFAVLAVHVIVMLVAARLFRLNVFSIAVASLAHIGGVASAPIVAASFDKRLVGVGVVMATAGYMVGTFVGLFVAWAVGAL